MIKVLANFSRNYQTRFTLNKANDSLTSRILNQGHDFLPSLHPMRRFICIHKDIRAPSNARQAKPMPILSMQYSSHLSEFEVFLG